MKAETTLTMPLSKAWSDEAREAAAEARRDGGGRSENSTGSFHSLLRGEGGVTELAPKEAKAVLSFLKENATKVDDSTFIYKNFLIMTHEQKDGSITIKAKKSKR